MLRLVEPETKIKKVSTITELNKMKPYLRSNDCECHKKKILCYTNDGECPCGEFKGHVHCICGDILKGE